MGKGAHLGITEVLLTDPPGIWTPDRLDQWLKDPKAYAPGTKMTFAGLPKEQDRANVVAYLSTLQ